MNSTTAMAVLMIVSGVSACERGGAEPVEDLPPPAPVERVTQVRSYPHDPTAFTQGLAWHAGNLYESTGRYGQSTLRRVNLQTGEVLQRVALPSQYFAEGVAVVGDSVFQLTWREGVMFIYDRPNLQRVGELEYNGEAWGLTSDGNSLIVSDGSNYLTFMDARSYEPQRTLPVTDGGQAVNQLNELEWVRGEIWANVWHTNHIVRIDPATGRVKGRLDLTDLVPREITSEEAVLNGIAYDPEANRLLVTGKLWPRLFEVSVPSLGVGAAAASAP